MEEAWSTAASSEEFVDIEGVLKPLPRFSTRMKILWDNTYLYIAAELEEPHLWATLTEINSVIYRDHDFEVFVDPNADNHNYYEFEINAFNTIWELRMFRPYRDGGPNKNPDNMDGVLAAVNLKGSINDPSDVDEGWSVEIAFPWTGFSSYGTDGSPPEEGEQWRINFSRVEQKLKNLKNGYTKPKKTPPDNWTWTPQGAISMHMPERWGFLQFSGEEPAEFIPDPSMEARDLLMEVHYMQKAFTKSTGRYSSTLDSLGLKSEQGDYLIRMWGTDTEFNASIESPGNNTGHAILYINERGRLWRTGRQY